MALVGGLLLASGRSPLSRAMRDDSHWLKSDIVFPREQQAQPSTVLIGPNLTFHKHGLVTLILALQLIRFHQEWCVHGSLSYKDVSWQSRKKHAPRVARKSYLNCRFGQFELHQGFWKVSRSRKNKVGSAPSKLIGSFCSCDVIGWPKLLSTTFKKPQSNYILAFRPCSCHVAAGLPEKHVYLVFFYTSSCKSTLGVK